jgi:hypothetical protein
LLLVFRVKGQKTGGTKIKNAPYPESGYGAFFIVPLQESGQAVFLCPT